jgi:hypothetical protein
MRLKKYSEFRRINENHPDGPLEWDDSKMSKAKMAKYINYKIIEESDWSIAIFRNVHTNLYYCFVIESIETSEFHEYAELPLFPYYNEDGGTDYYPDEDAFEMDMDVIESYVNDKINSLDYGEGIEDYQAGEANFILIDEPLKELLKKEFDLKSI